jgi:hypothetical protein
MIRTHIYSVTITYEGEPEAVAKLDKAFKAGTSKAVQAALAYTARR